MSITAVQGRMAEIQALIAAANPAPVSPAAGGTSFASTLAGASGGSTSSGAGAGTTGTVAGQVPGAAGATTAGTATAGATAAAGGTPAPAGVPTGGSDGGRYAPMIEAAARRHGIDPQVFTNLVRQESGFDPNAGSAAGARGLCQLMPGTAASLGVKDLTDPAQSLEGGATYLAQQLKTFGGDYTKAVAAYNAGPGAVQRFGGVPPYAETRNYVQTILGRAA